MVADAVKILYQRGDIHVGNYTYDGDFIDITDPIDTVCDSIAHSYQKENCLDWYFSYWVYLTEQGKAKAQELDKTFDDQPYDIRSDHWDNTNGYKPPPDYQPLPPL